jgi:hypothetical protein
MPSRRVPPRTTSAAGRSWAELPGLPETGVIEAPWGSTSQAVADNPQARRLNNESRFTHGRACLCQSPSSH